MKIVTSFILGLAFYSSLFYYGCKDAYKETPAKTDTVYVHLYDTVTFTPVAVSTTRYDSTFVLLNRSIKQCVKTKDSLSTELFLAKYKLEKVQYYLKIVERNPSQIKYIKGWLRRALE